MDHEEKRFLLADEVGNENGARIERLADSGEIEGLRIVQGSETQRALADLRRELLLLIADLAQTIEEAPGLGRAALRAKAGDWDVSIQARGIKASVTGAADLAKLSGTARD